MAHLPFFFLVLSLLWPFSTRSEVVELPGSGFYGSCDEVLGGCWYYDSGQATCSEGVRRFNAMFGQSLSTTFEPPLTCRHSNGTSGTISYYPCALGGFNTSTGECTAPPPPPVNCPTAGTPSEGVRYYTTDLAATPRFYGHSDGQCVVEETNRVCTGDGTGYHCVAENKYTGTACGPSGCQGAGTSDAQPGQHPEPNPADPPNSGPCQAGYYYGTVNGQTVCVPGQSSHTSNTTSTTTTGPAGTVEKSQTTVTSTGTSSNGTQTTTTTQTTLEHQWSAARQITNQSESSFPSAAIPATTGATKTTTVTNPDGSRTEYTLTKNPDGTVSGTARDQNTVEKTETTTCTGSSCTVSSTTNTNGQETGSTAGTTDKDGLCKESPDNAQCGDGDGMFAGTCSAGFQCDGDAVQCAIAKKQHEAACAFLENKTAESELYEAEKNKPGNVTGGNPNNSTQVIGSGMFDYSSATGGGSCIPNKTITVMGQSIDLPFSNICTWLEVLGNVLVSVSSLIALRIVMRG